MRGVSVTNVAKARIQSSTYHLVKKHPRNHASQLLFIKSNEGIVRKPAIKSSTKSNFKSAVEDQRKKGKMHNEEVHITSHEKISIPKLEEAPSSIKLSFFDALWIPLKPVQKVLIYSSFETNQFPFSTVIQQLKSSLSSALLDFLPLAGKLAYVADIQDVEIDLSELGFTFIEAESNLDVQQLSCNETIDVVSFSKLVPMVDVSVLPFHVLAVQVTRFKGGGMAIGYSIHHMAADGNATTKFVQAWSSTCKANLNGTKLPEECRPSLTYDRGMIKHPKGEQIKRAILLNTAPDLPSTMHPKLAALMEKRINLSSRMFQISKQCIDHLKQLGSDQSGKAVPSTFSAISAYVWTTVARAKSFDPEDETIFSVMMDCRSRLDPPIPDGYIGNCIRALLTKVKSGDLIGGGGMVYACKALRESVEKVGKDPLWDVDEWVNVFTGTPLGRLVNASSSPKFKVYEYDFGWGKPDRFEMVSVNTDGEFVLVAGKEEGSVQMTIAIAPEKLDTFSSLFLQGLNG